MSELQRCKGTNCGCTDGVSHSAECRAEHDALCCQAEIGDLRAEVARLRTQLEMWQDGNIMADSHRDEVASLKAERDEARRLYCEARYREERADLRSTPTSPHVIAAERGWDCFKEEDK